MIVSFSGIDGAGKSTQAQRLAAALAKGEQQLFSVEDVHPARIYSAPTELDQLAASARQANMILCRFYLANARTAELQAKLKYSDFHTGEERRAAAAAAFYAAHQDAVEWQQRFAKPLLLAGKTLIYDRWAFDEIIYRVPDGLNPQRLAVSYRCFPQPDAAFWIDTPVELLPARVGSKPDSSSTLFREPERIAALAQVFRTLAPELGLTRIDGGQDCATVHAAVLAALHELCGGR